MNKFKIFTLLFALLTLSVLTGCSKDDENEPSRTALLTASTWQGSKIMVDGTDYTSFFDMTETSMVFKTDGTYQMTLEGDVETGTWEFTANEQKLLVDKGSDDETTLDILTLSGSELKLKWIQENSQGDDSTIEMHFTKK